MRCLSLDIGDKTVGVAVSDPLGITAQGVKTIQRTSKKNDFKEIGDLISEYEVDTLIIGLPKNMNGTEGERCEIVRKFAARLQGRFPAVNQIFWDERLSTVAAEKSLIAADVSRQKRKKVIDKMAAVYILQGYLDSLTLKGEILMAKKKNVEENIVEENVVDENIDDEEFGDIIVEMTDDEGNTYLYLEQMIIPVGDDRFALLVEVPEHDHEHNHEHEDCDCGCGCGCEDGDVIIAKIVTDENGEDIYIEPTDEEFEAVQKAYDELIDDDFDEDEK